jgi:hypothetical protein
MTSAIEGGYNGSENEAMSPRCANCESTEVRSQPMAWATHGISTPVRTILAPPRQPSSAGVILAGLLFVGCAFIWIVPPGTEREPGVLIAAMILSLLLLVAIIARVKSQRVYRGAYADWERRWICLACGAVTDGMPSEPSRPATGIL